MLKYGTKDGKISNELCEKLLEDHDWRQFSGDESSFEQNDGNVVWNVRGNSSDLIKFFFHNLSSRFDLVSLLFSDRFVHSCHKGLEYFKNTNQSIFIPYVSVIQTNIDIAITNYK